MSQECHPLQLVDVHAHLCDSAFEEDIGDLVVQLMKADVRAVVVNGLDPQSNLRTLELAQTYPILQAAAGIYPVHAVHHLLPEDHHLKPTPFDVQEAIGSIEDLACRGKIIAVGECGMDGHWFPTTLEAQQRVFVQLIGVAKKYDLPLIVHSRKCEKKVMEVLAAHRARKVVFHCYMGKVRAALQGAKQWGWYFSVPAIAPRHQGFTKMLHELPQELLLTETDSPYLAPEAGERNDPRHVAVVIHHLAKLRQWSYPTAAAIIWQNYQRLFGG